MVFHENESVSLFLSELIPIEIVASPKQKIEFYKHPILGKVLIINGEIQHVEKYQAMYHEMLVHLPMSFIRKPKTVLILGGGSLFAAYEALKYPSVSNVVLCDYDSEVLNIMNKHYQHAHHVMNCNRFTYIEENAFSYIDKCKLKFDLVINDCFNIAKCSMQSQMSYYRLLSSLCTETGVCVDIIYRHIFDKETTQESLKYLKGEKELAMSLVIVPEYPGILHLETIWGNNANLNQYAHQSCNLFHLDLLRKSLSTPFSYFSPCHIPYYLYLPPYIRNMFSI